jgi:cell division protein FtsW
VICLALVLTRLGTDINGAKRWLMLRVGSHALSFEPSELAKWSLVLFISVYAVHRGQQIRSFWKGFVPLMAIVGATSALILKEDFGTAALVAGISVLLMLMAGCRWWHIAMLLPPALVVLYFAVWHVPYRRERLLIFMHPHMDPKGAGYNPIQSLLSFASGGFWGRGLGDGIQKMGYLPEDNTDFIFSLIAEELGFFGCMMVILLYLSLLFSGWQVARRSQDLFGKLLAFGCTAMIGLQAAMNIAVVTVTVPTKGIALPLISSGGTGWILTAGAIGLVMSVERVNRLEAGDRGSGGKSSSRGSSRGLSLVEKSAGIGAS